MKITFKTANIETSAEITDDCDVYQVLETVAGLLTVVGFHPDTVVRGYRSLGGEDDIEV